MPTDDRYDRTSLRPGIVHLGLGAFARAHLCAYTDEVLAGSAPEEREWGVVGVSLRSPATRDALAPRSGRYTLVVRDSEGAQLRPIGAVLRVLVEPEEPTQVAELLADPAIRIVTMTVTEKGYAPDQPAARVLNDALAARRSAGVAPPTLVSLDNLVDSGGTLRRLLLETAEADLAEWIGEHVSFPSSMVDRIVPATAEEDRELVRHQLGVDDPWPVRCEPFSQWVVEDRFPTGRPRWETSGVQLVDDAAPWVRRKLRGLNAAHLALACVGRLAGHTTIASAVADAAISSHAQRLLLDECLPTIDHPDELDHRRYTDTVLGRFANTSLHHRCTQILSDASHKVPQRWVPNISRLLLADRSVDQHARAVAAWLAVLASDEPWREEVSDPPAERLAGRGLDALEATEVFGDVGSDPRFRRAVSEALGRLTA